MNPKSMMTPPVDAPPVDAPPVDAPPSDAPPVDAPPSDIVIPENWKQAIPEEFRTDPSLEAISDFDGLVKSYVNAQKMIGADKIIVPNKHDDGTLFREAMVKLGLPKDAEEYKINYEGEIDENIFNTFKEKSFEAGILPNQAEGLFNAVMEKYNETNNKMMEEYNNSIIEKQNELKTEWGEGFDGKIQMASDAAKYLAGEDQGLYEELLSPEITGNPAVVKILAKVGDMLKEDDLIKGPSGQWGQTPEQVQGEINAIMADPKHPYNSADHPNHEKAVKEVRNLYAKLS